MLVNKTKAIIAVCIALTVFFSTIHHFMQTVVLKVKENVKKLICFQKTQVVRKMQKPKGNSNAKIKITIVFLSEKQYK